MFPVNLIHEKAQASRLPYLVIGGHAVKLHALAHGPADRYEKDFGDIVNVARNVGLDVDSPVMVEIFRRYATPAIYEKVRQRLKPGG